MEGTSGVWAWRFPSADDVAEHVSVPFCPLFFTGYPSLLQSQLLFATIMCMQTSAFKKQQPSAFCTGMSSYRRCLLSSEEARLSELPAALYLLFVTRRPKPEACHSIDRSRTRKTQVRSGPITQISSTSPFFCFLLVYNWYHRNLEC